MLEPDIITGNGDSKSERPFRVHTTSTTSLASSSRLPAGSLRQSLNHWQRSSQRHSAPRRAMGTSASGLVSRMTWLLGVASSGGSGLNPKAQKVTHLWAPALWDLLRDLSGRARLRAIARLTRLSPHILRRLKPQMYSFKHVPLAHLGILSMVDEFEAHQPSPASASSSLRPSPSSIGAKVKS